MPPPSNTFAARFVNHIGAGKSRDALLELLPGVRREGAWDDLDETPLLLRGPVMTSCNLWRSERCVSRTTARVATPTAGRIRARLLRFLDALMRALAAPHI